jgi:hypothetical protein
MFGKDLDGNDAVKPRISDAIQLAANYQISMTGQICCNVVEARAKLPDLFAQRI